MEVYHITAANFQREVVQSEETVLLDFWAPWCGPCRMLAPMLEQVAEEVEDVKVCKVNIDEELELARMFQIMSIPTLVVIKDGNVVNSAVGFRPKEFLINMVTEDSLLQAMEQDEDEK